MDRDAGLRSALARRGDLDLAGVITEEAEPVAGGGVAQHCARTGIQESSGEIRHVIAGGVTNGVDPRQAAVKIALVDPHGDRALGCPESEELGTRDASP